MKAIKIKSEFIMSDEEIKSLAVLPDNLPDTHLTAKQKSLVNDLYYKYIGKTIDRQDWSADMYKVEQREKWPSGPRVKEHEAKRMIIGNLSYLNQSHKNMTPNVAVKLFHSSLSCREMYSKLVYKIYDVKY